LVLTKLRKMIFNFLSSGCSDHPRQHLCNWVTLAKPKQKGGWGIINPIHFSQAIATASLWWVLTCPSIWHSIITDKYLSHFTIKSWLLVQSASPRTVSFFWRNITKTKSLITSWLCWHLGSGSAIQLGRDHISGLNASDNLSPQLISHLHSINIWYLSQIKETSTIDHQPNRWVTSATLGLNPVLTSEWNEFHLALILSCIRLTNSKDYPLWQGAIASEISLYKTFILQFQIHSSAY
jgi:hypothetical protein